MNITKETVEYIARLSALALDGSECERQRESLEDVLSYMDVLGCLDTDGAEPLVHLTDDWELRADETAPSYLQEQILSGAPERRGEAFSVPKTVTS